MCNTKSRKCLDFLQWSQEYYENGQQSKNIGYYENGNKQIVMEFDVNGNLIVDETYNENGERV